MFASDSCMTTLDGSNQRNMTTHRHVTTCSTQTTSLAWLDMLFYLLRRTTLRAVIPSRAKALTRGGRRRERVRGGAGEKEETMREAHYSMIYTSTQGLQL